METDRGFSNVEWKHQFLNMQVVHLSASHSDHLPIMITDEGLSNENKKWENLPRFGPYWLNDEECENIFLTSWNSTLPSSAIELANTIVKTRESMRTWASKKFGSLSEKKKEDKLQKELASIITSADYNPIKEREVLEELEKTTSMEEEYWRIRGKSQWLTSMDSNTAFFHHKANSRRERNTIKELVDSNGNLASELKKLKKITVEYFSDIYRTNETLIPSLDPLDLHHLEEDDINFLAMPYTEFEISKALSQLPGKNSPGAGWNAHGLYAKILEIH